MFARRHFFALAALFLIAAASPARAADNGVMLGAEAQKTLMALKPLRDQGADRALFDGKPLLVVFFSSW